MSSMDEEVQKSTSLIPGDKWVVAVKHLDGLEEVVEVNQLDKHKPATAEDFEYGRKYTIWSLNGRYRGKECAYKMYIGRIAENRAALDLSIAKSRLEYPPLYPTDSDQSSSESNFEMQMILPGKESNTAQGVKKRGAASQDLDDPDQFLKSDQPSSSGMHSHTAPKRMKESKSALSSNISESDSVSSCNLSNNSSKKSVIHSSQSAEEQLKTITVGSDAKYFTVVKEIITQKDKVIEELTKQVKQWKKIALKYKEYGNEIASNIENINSRLDTVESALKNRLCDKFASVTRWLDNCPVACDTSSTSS